MNSADYNRYWVPAVKNLFGHSMTLISSEEWLELNSYLDKALDVSVWNDFEIRPISSDFPLTTEMRELLTKLAGPNGKFYLKVYQAQHGLLEVT